MQEREHDFEMCKLLDKQISSFSYLHHTGMIISLLLFFFACILVPVVVQSRAFAFSYNAVLNEFNARNFTFRFRYKQRKHMTHLNLHFSSSTLYIFLNAIEQRILVLVLMKSKMSSSLNTKIGNSEKMLRFSLRQKWAPFMRRQKNIGGLTRCTNAMRF